MANIRHKTALVEMKTRKNGLISLSPSFLISFLFKEESDEFHFSDIYTRGCFDGSQNLKKILKKLIAKIAAKK